MTNDMNTTVKLLGEVFPWLAPSVHFSSERCDIGHANRSPPNPCGDKALPPHPDAATKKLIQKYNHLDIEVHNTLTSLCVKAFAYHIPCRFTLSLITNRNSDCTPNVILRRTSLDILTRPSVVHQPTDQPVNKLIKLPTTNEPIS